MKPKSIAFPLVLVLSSPAMAGDYIWRGTSNSTWTDPANWDLTTAPPAAPGDTHAVPGKNYPGDRLNIANGVNSGAVYDPGAGVTTTFRSGRGLLIGSGAGNTANLTVSSGTIAVVNPGGTGQEPLMANGASANLLINGGTIDLTGTSLKFILVNAGLSGLTSTMTMTSGAFSCAGFEFFQGGGGGTSTVNLDGGVMSLTRFLKTQTNTASALNLDGGTLRLRSSQTSPNQLLSDLLGLTTTVEDGGVVVDTNTFNGTIAEVLEHDASLGTTPDGGLTKSGAGTLTLSGANTFTGPVTINAGPAAGTPSRLLLANNSGAGTGAITMAGDFSEIQVGNTRAVGNSISVSDTSAEKTILLPSPGSGAFASANFSGPISINETNIDHFKVRSDDNCFLTFSGVVSGSGGILKFQSGRLDLTNGSNTFTGDVKITHGSVSFTEGALGSTGQIRMEGGPTVNGVTLRWDPTNNQDISSRLVMYDGKAATLLLADGGEPFDISNVVFADAIGNNSTASLVKSGNGSLTLTQPSTYSGGTTITQGILEFANGGLGGSGAVTMNGGILRWSSGNSADLSSRLVMVDAKTAALSTNGNDITFASAIGNFSTGNFSKTNTAGTLTLAAGNSYIGTTTVGGGTLALGASNALPDSSNVTIGAATLDAATFTDSAGTLDVSAAATIQLGAGATLSFANSSAVSWSGGSLSISGTFVSGSSLRFGTDGTGLTPAQLAQISSPGLTAFALDSSGYLTATPAGGYSVWQTANNTSQTIDQDHDGDGVSNGVEYFLSGAASSTGFTSLPTVVDNAGVLSITWKKSSGYNGIYSTDFVVETSTTLSGAWTTVVLVAGADGVVITGDAVKYTFPSGSKKFARLKVTGP